MFQIMSSEVVMMVIILLSVNAAAAPWDRYGYREVSHKILKMKRESTTVLSIQLLNIIRRNGRFSKYFLGLFSSLSSCTHSNFQRSKVPDAKEVPFWFLLKHVNYSLVVSSNLCIPQCILLCIWVSENLILSEISLINPDWHSRLRAITL